MFVCQTVLIVFIIHFGALFFRVLVNLTLNNGLFGKTHYNFQKLKLCNKNELYFVAFIDFNKSIIRETSYKHNLNLKTCKILMFGNRTSFSAA